MKYKVGWFLFLANSWAKTILYTEIQVKFRVEETDCILDCRSSVRHQSGSLALSYLTSGPNAGEIIGEVVL